MHCARAGDETGRRSVNAKRLDVAIKLVGLLLACGLIVGASGCAQSSSSTSSRPPTPTPPVRYRDAYPLMLTLQDLGKGYQIVETHRLERGRGWSDDATRLSGYRTVYQGNGATFTQVLCQVECYLSEQDARVAYQAYKEKLAASLRKEIGQASADESETRFLGEWGWAFSVRAETADTVHYLFSRENVLVEVAFTGPQSATFADRTTRQAQVVDQRILAR
jgi:hypothetical protein